MFDQKNLPNEPGCYLFKDKNNKVIYVGKAKNLKKRVKSYVHKDDLDIKTQSMVKHIKYLDFVATDSEVEALILEDTLIKKHQPKYNIRLKDAKSHSYILITDEVFPRALIARRKIGSGRFYGPFVSASERDYILQFLKKTFLLRTCNKLPKKVCLRYHINLCEGPCIGLISKKDYNEKIKNVKLILSGKTDRVLKNLEQYMIRYSERQQFEKAMITRNQINAIVHLNERQKVQREKRYNEDIINFQIKDDKVYLMVFNIYKGTLANKNEFPYIY
jgi:excinuclease ABC subunit C